MKTNSSNQDLRILPKKDTQNIQKIVNLTTSKRNEGSIYSFPLEQQQPIPTVQTNEPFERTNERTNVSLEIEREGEEAEVYHQLRRKWRIG